MFEGGAFAGHVDECAEMIRAEMRLLCVCALLLSIEGARHVSCVQTVVVGRKEDVEWRGGFLHLFKGRTEPVALWHHFHSL
jgi:hypothetical protein